MYMKGGTQMKPHTIIHLFKEGFAGLWKNRMMALASMATIILSLLVLGISYSIAQNFEHIVKQIEVQMGITAYINEQYTDADITRLQDHIENLTNVVNVDFISKDAALKIFAGEDLELYHKYKDDNPLPRSFEIKVSEATYQANVVENLNRIEGLEISYFEAETQIFVELNNSIQIFSMFLISLLIMIALLLINNTIKLTVYVRKKEIEIMKNIGATDNFIRIPFLIEGLTIGIIGAIIPAFIIVRIYQIAEDYLSVILLNLVGGISLRSINSILIELVPIYLILGVCVSALGSGVAIRRHLKV